MTTIYQDYFSFAFTTLVEGDTSTPTKIKIAALAREVAYASGFAVRVRVIDENGYGDATNATIAAVSGRGNVVKTYSATKDLDIQSQSIDVAATETLTISGVTIDGETVTLGSRVYEFDTDGSVTPGNVAVDTSGAATASAGTLTLDTQPTAGDTMTIGNDTFVWVADGTDDNDWEISVGADLAAAKVNVVAKVNALSTVASLGTFSGDDSVVTASVPGTAGDAIVSTETYTAVGNVFDAATLGTTVAGVDAAAAASVTALAAAITGDGSAVVTGVDGAGDTVDVTAITAGSVGNTLASTETMANGAFGGAVLSGGIDNTPDSIEIEVTNATAETVTIALGPPELLGIPVNYAEAKVDVVHAAP